MLRSLYARQALVFSLLLLILAAIYLPLSLHSTRLYQQETEQSFNRDLASHLATSRALMDAGGMNKAMLKEVFDLYMVINPSIEVFLLDAQGKILDHALHTNEVILGRVDPAPIRAFLEGSTPLPIFGDDPRVPGRHTVFSAVEVQTPDGRDGYLYVVLQANRYHNLAGMVEDSHILRMVVLALVCMLVAGLVVGLILFRLLTRRLSRLNRAMHAFSDADQQPPDQELASFRENGDEIDQLARAFLGLTDRIHRQVVALRDQDRLRRELVANASHDLRTPLAALLGYLETLELRQSRLTDEERAEYLRVARRHGERMSQLVGELFELARLEALDYQPTPEPLVMAELTQDVMQKYGQRASAAGVQLQMEASGPQPMIQGDIGMLERVLENLLENALRHTPDGGRVTLSLAADDQSQQLAVADTGCGIPEAEIPLVFQRHFHGATSKGGTGLGLAIARRIVELHRGEIQVSSRVGEGSRFTIQLPRTQAAV